MLLAVDIGNSQTSFGVFDQERLVYHWRASTRPSRTSDEYGALLFPLLEKAGISQGNWEAIVLCSVVPPADPAFEQFCQEYWNTTPYKVSVQRPLDFRVNVQIPSQVGADRLANAAYAVKYMKLPALVIDFGTATTFDVVSADPAYEGGAILPGVRISAEVLSSKTSQLPSIDLAFPSTVIGKNTVECIQGGVLYGYLDMVDGLIARVATELKSMPEIALTGGLASLFQGKLRHKAQLLPNLTLEGIRVVYEAAKNSSRS